MTNHTAPKHTSSNHARAEKMYHAWARYRALTLVNQTGSKCNLVALLDSPNRIGLNCPKNKSFLGLWGFFFTMLAFRKKSPFITWRCNDMAWPWQKLASRPGALCGGLISTMRPAIFFAEEVMIKPTVLNSPPPLLCWFYQQTKNHTAIHYRSVYHGLLSWVSENWLSRSKNRKSICGSPCW